MSTVSSRLQHASLFEIRLRQMERQERTEKDACDASGAVLSNPRPRRPIACGAANTGTSVVRVYTSLF